ncbi:type I DNA topoisomerase [Candidatus Saccharibacteria bacterium]|nr:type I DNA topoisomerase [Candidatus Saccharibacteria bacterium]
MPKNLVIVESPAKAKTLAQFLGGDYQIKSSLGHIRDLPVKGMGVDIGKNFEPTYEVHPDKAKVAAELRSAAKGRDVWLATDEDREGEAIAWHVCILLKLNPEQTKRIVFHEITEPAIKAAVAKPRTVDMKLVDAQQARRILDRLIGYKLSPLIMKKISAGARSAGRVQSVAVRLIVEREREIKDFASTGNYKITARFQAGAHEIEAELPAKLEAYETAKQFLESLVGAKFSVGEIEQKPGNRSPGIPFTTSSLQQEAARRLGYSVRQTMSLAQKLYQSGHITYMRTDSPNLSQQAISAAKDYIIKTFGQKYWHQRQFKAKSSGAQEAHEAIRPTNLSRDSAGNDSSQEKLYNLIWRRTVASQMAPAAVLKTTIAINNDKRDERLVASGEILTFDGYLKVYGGGREDKLLPNLKTGQTLQLLQMLATETFSRPPARYSEASLVRKLEELGIGRPSTYAPTISTIQDRGYVEKKDVEGENVKAKELKLEQGHLSEQAIDITIGADRNKLIPTDLAGIVTDFLVKYFEKLMDYEFTARAEAQFDEIAEGKLVWQTMLKDFYDKFEPLLGASEQASRKETSQSRLLGYDPGSAKPIYARFARYGPVLQMGESPEDSKDKASPKPQFAPLPQGATQADVTLEQALPMFELPREVGKTTDGELITANIGRFGPYLQAGKIRASLKEHDPFKIAEDQARDILASHAKTVAERQIADFGKLKILRGPYGPYVTDGQKNARIPKEVDPKSLDEAAAAKLLAEAPAKKRRFRRRKS